MGFFGEIFAFYTDLRDQKHAGSMLLGCLGVLWGSVRDPLAAHRASSASLGSLGRSLGISWALLGSGVVALGALGLPLGVPQRSLGFLGGLLGGTAWDRWTSLVVLEGAFRV